MSATTLHPAFAVDGVSYSYAAVPALRRLSLTIQAGERVALLGANGSGKSTLLRILAGLLFPAAGTVTFFGEAVTPQALERQDFFFRFRRRVGFVFQNPDIQLFNPTVFDEIAFGPLQLGWKRAEIIAKVEQQMEEMGISALRNRAPHRLSGGEKKRVALASVLVLNPDVLLLDEPAAALDPHSQDQILALIHSFAGSARTVITATHDLDTVEQIAGRCCVLKDGALEADAPPLAILHDVPLLERSRLLRPLRHTHKKGSATPHPHPHVHLTEPD